MKKTIYQVKILLIVIISMIILAGCGNTNPAGAGRFVAGNTNPATMTVTVKFPTRPAAYMMPQPLISASTLLLDIGVYAAGTNTLVASGAIAAPPTGGIASTTIKIYQYEGPVYVNVAGFNTSTVTYPMAGYIGGVSKNQPMTGNIQQTGLNIAFGVSTPLSMVFIEGDQGVANISGMSMVSPDGTTYIVNDLFLLYVGTWGQSYSLAARLTNASTGVVSYTYSSQNTDWVSFKSTSVITDASTTLSLQIPAADGKTWNRYDYNLNFAPGGIPTNTPTISQMFMGTIAHVNGTGPHNYAIGWNGTQYIMGGQSSILLTSPDAISWTPRNNPVAGYSLRAIASGSNKLVAVGDMGTTITSADGITWTSVFSTTWGLFDVIWSGTQYVLAAAGGMTLSSFDTLTWTSYLPTGMSLSGVTYSPTLVKYVEVGAGGTIITSSDAVTWAAASSGTINNLNKVTWSGTQFVAVGDIGTIITSSDAVTWTIRTSPTANNLRKVVWSGTQFVAVGTNGTILTSADGITWTLQISGTVQTLQDIVWTGAQYVACGDNGVVLSSPNGVNWTLRNVWSQGTNFTLPAASWSNQVAPAPPAIQTVVF